MITIVTDAFYGSSGKGAICSALPLRNKYDLLVAQNGPNAGHTTRVSGVKRVWKVLPSACASTTGVPVLLGPGTIYDPAQLAKERVLYDGPVFIHYTAIALREEDTLNEKYTDTLIRNASTRQGTGSAAIRKLMREDLQQHVDGLDVIIVDTPHMMSLYEAANTNVLHEVAQGVLLGIDHGSYPYVTSRNCTAATAAAQMCYRPNRCVNIALYRSYPIRVGNADGYSGPFHGSEEISWGVVAARSGKTYEELCAAEHTTVTGRLRRVAEWSCEMVRLSSRINQPDFGILTFADYCTMSEREERLKHIHDVTGTPTLAYSVGPTPQDIKWAT